MKREKDAALRRVLVRFGRVLIAYSGGVDSTYLVAVARRLLGKDNVLAVTAASETYPAAELRQARALARRLGVRHRVIRTAELRNPLFAANPRERCFHCKDELFGKLAALAKRSRMTLCDATNVSDSADFRPGRKAAVRWGVASPLVEAGMTKDDIRAASKALRLPTWNQPARACLASRFPYGTALTVTELRKVERAEEFLEKLGYPGVRVRTHGPIARIEVAPEKVAGLASVRHAVPAARFLKRLGWLYITVDLEGYRTGSLNEEKPSG